MINSLKHLREINGKNIHQHPSEVESNGEYCPIKVNHVNDKIEFSMMTVPQSKGGDLKDCQWSDLVTLGLEQLKYFNEKFPCKENSVAITHIETALLWNDKRTQDRVKRNVEGKEEL